MTFHKTFAVFGLLCLGALALCAAPKKSPYTAEWNQKRIQEISMEILRQVNVQEEEYKRAYEEWQRQKNGSNGGNGGYGDWRDAGHGMDPRPGGNSDGKPKQETFPPFKLDIQKIKDVIRQKFGGREEDAVGAYPRVDLRNKMDLLEIATETVRARPEFKDYNPEEIARLIQDVEERYPLYFEGKSVEIGIDGKTYFGVFKTEGANVIWIGDKSFKKNKLPREVLAYFDPQINVEFRKRELSKNPILAKELEELEKKYPLYKEGQTVEISFAHGNEPRRTYKGTFKALPPFKLWIGRDMLNKNDLPEIYRARFFSDVNAQCRQAEFEKHLELNRLRLALEDAIAEEVKKMLEKQFEKNLPKGWVFLNDVWKMPSELVEDTLEYRKEDRKIRQGGGQGRDRTGGISIMGGSAN